MDTPKPPEDLELRNIIDKLAQFVARNGPDFEQMTMNKQHGNPKFMFLFGGEFNAYYRYRVAAEQQQLQQPQTFHQHPPASQPQIPPPTLPMPPVGNNNFFPNHHQLPLPPIPSFPPVSQSPSFNNNFIQQPPAHPHAFHPHPHNPPSMPPQPPQHCPPILFPGLPDEPFQFGQKPVPNWQPPPIPPPLPPQPPPQLKTQQIGPNNLQSVQKNDFESDNRLDIQIKQLNDHIKESEKNLNAQKEVIMGIEMEQQINEMIIKQLDDELKRMCEDFNINLNEFDKILQPIIDTCRKESIANGKIWIFNHCNNDEQYDAVAKHLLKRVSRTNESFDGKLHIMYLINDIFNHCMRKNDKKLKTAIINIIVPAFATVMIDANDERKLKMNKLLKIWETNQYLDDALLEKLRQSNQSLDDYKIDLRNKYREQIKSIEQKQSDKYKKIEKQHLDFVAHANEQIKQLNSQKSMNNIRQSQSFESPSNGILPSSLPVSSGIPFAPPTVVNSFVHSTSPISSNLMSPSLPPPHLPLQRLPFPSPFHPPPPQHHPPHFYPTANNFQMYPTIPSYASAIMPSSPQILSDTLPSQSNGARPYFESPAALMTTLIKLEDFDYNPIDPKLIEFPTLEPPTEHLLQALDAFYSPPTHEHPRNADGWEKLGLYEFFKRKSQARKEYEINVLGQKEDDNKNNVDTKSINDPDSSSISTTNNKDKDKKHKDKDKQNDKHQKNEKASTSKKSYKEFKEKSRSPSHHRSRKRSRSRSRSRSPHRKRSKSPKKSRSNKSSSRSRSKSPEFSKVKNNINDNSKYSNDNKNPLMTKRMTWSSSTGFTIKDTKTDHTNEGQYVGLGVDSHHHHHEKKSPDPFESFRRNKGQEYMQRIRDGGFAGANVVRRD